MSAYDEFGLLAGNAAEVGLPPPDGVAVERRFVEVGGGRRVSAIRWGAASSEPEIVLLHGGAQNAHTWDTVALALGLPLLAVDLPGHGHSDWRADGAYSLEANADDVAAVIRALAPGARTVVGMSLGGMTAVTLAARHPALVPRLALVDVTPGVDHGKAAAILTFVSGPREWESFEALLAYTVEHNPTRTESSLRRGVLHNAVERSGGTWEWRWDPQFAGGDRLMDGLAQLWDHIAAYEALLMLVRGGASPVVSDDDVAELLRRRPDALVEVVDGAGHSIQGDRPLDLAHLIAAFHG